MGRWQELSREELERQYSPSRWSPRLGAAAVVEAHVREVTAGTRRAQAAAGAVLQVPYGTGEREALDVYLPAGPAGAFPLVLYVHGGYWQFLSKEESGFAAPPLLSRGIALGAVGYDVAPRGNMDAMVAQVRRSTACVVRQYPTTSGVYLCGHSAGAHLAAMVLATDWQEYGVTPDIKGAFLVSGIYDLEPIVSTYVNDALRMTPEVAQRNSPLLHVAAATPATGACEVLVVVAQHDSPEFHRQSRQYFQALRSAGWTVSLLDVARTDHFDVVEKLSQEGYILTQVLLNAVAGA